MNGSSTFGRGGLIAAGFLSAAAAAYYFATRSSGGGPSVAANDASSGASDAENAGGLTAVASTVSSWFENFGESIGIVTPRGIRNNNPGNLEFAAGIDWLGQVGADSANYVIFDTAEHGARALGHDLATAISEGYNTPATLITHYAPPSENDTAAYIRAVAAWGQIEEGTTLQVGDAPWIAAAVATQENGQGPWTAPNGLQYSATDVQTWAGEA